MGIPPLRYAVQMGSDVSLGSSVPPDRSVDAELGPCNETHLVTDPVRDRSRQPPHPLGVDTFRLILPEDIAIGIRFSHASRAN